MELILRSLVLVFRIKIVFYMIIFPELITKSVMATCDCSSDNKLGLQDPASSIMEGIFLFNLHLLFIIINIVILVGWLVMLIITNYIETSNEIVSEFTYSNILDIIWTSIPTLTLLLVASPSFSLLYSLDEISSPELKFKILGHQWHWTYEVSDFKTCNTTHNLKYASYIMSNKLFEREKLNSDAFTSSTLLENLIINFNKVDQSIRKDIALLAVRTECFKRGDIVQSGWDIKTTIRNFVQLTKRINIRYSEKRLVFSLNHVCETHLDYLIKNFLNDIFGPNEFHKRYKLQPNKKIELSFSLIDAIMTIIFMPWYITVYLGIRLVINLGLTDSKNTMDVFEIFMTHRRRLKKRLYKRWLPFLYKKLPRLIKRKSRKLLRFLIKAFFATGEATIQTIFPVIAMYTLIVLSMDLWLFINHMLTIFPILWEYFQVMLMDTFNWILPQCNLGISSIGVTEISEVTFDNLTLKELDPEDVPEEADEQDDNPMPPGKRLEESFFYRHRRVIVYGAFFIFGGLVYVFIPEPKN